RYECAGGWRARLSIHDAGAIEQASATNDELANCRSRFFEKASRELGIDPCASYHQGAIARSHLGFVLIDDCIDRQAPF
ncbi:hypothetical protein, partial [Bradyrhizobium sp.]|uniref:hypothetical protein n=1 Tax=Bradyrhizobium sp. TaxID=376 RepID=UPI003C6FE524